MTLFYRQSKFYYYFILVHSHNSIIIIPIGNTKRLGLYFRLVRNINICQDQYNENVYKYYAAPHFNS